MGDGGKKNISVALEANFQLVYLEGWRCQLPGCLLPWLHIHFNTGLNALMYTVCESIFCFFPLQPHMLPTASLLRRWGILYSGVGGMERREFAKQVQTIDILGRNSWCHITNTRLVQMPCSSSPWFNWFAMSEQGVWRFLALVSCFSLSCQPKFDAPQQSRDCHVILTNNLWIVKMCQIPIPIQGLKLAWNWDLAPPHNPEIFSSSDKAISGLLHDGKLWRSEGVKEWGDGFKNEHTCPPLVWF